ncbi:hypothetical protein GCM10028803_30640 [Larkinella knui]|uniref:Uncharacterized protein n=1 Tax=Larkinella knui TaxID=2025310 RepID=A0A3P1CYB8_9BACT|nr:hypothetical protein [Larkinella knui]RRB18090.1 hypothetical protein EHT87_07400 [Larkinella knui]
MKDFLKAFIPVTIAVLVYTYLAENGDMSQALWPLILLLIATFTIAVYVLIRVFRRKKFPDSRTSSSKNR